MTRYGNSSITSARLTPLKASSGRLLVGTKSIYPSYPSRRPLALRGRPVEELNIQAVEDFLAYAIDHSQRAVNGFQTPISK